MKNYPAARLVGLKKQGRGIAEVLDAIRVYTDRHYKRCEELIEESYLVDFVVRGMEEGGFVADDSFPVSSAAGAPAAAARLGENGVNRDGSGDVVMVG